MIYTDKVQVGSVTTNYKGEQTESAPIYKARVERINKIRYGQDGRVVTYNTLILLPPDAIIKEGDNVTITKLRGQSQTAREMTAKEVFPAGGRGLHHWEVYC